MVQNTYKNKGKNPATVSLSGNMPFGVLMPVTLDEVVGLILVPAAPGAKVQFVNVVF